MMLWVKSIISAALADARYYPKSDYNGDDGGAQWGRPLSTVTDMVHSA